MSRRRPDQGPSARRHGPSGPVGDHPDARTLTAATREESRMDTPQDHDRYADRTDDRDDLLGVVVGVDGSRIGLDAVRWAVAEARLRGLPLRILHAAPYAAGSTAGTRHARDILARAYTVAHRADLDLPVTTRHTERDAVPSLLDAAQRAQLLVVGMGGGERPQEVLIGS